MKVLLLVAVVLLSACSASAPPDTAPTPLSHGAYVPVSVDNNRPEAVTVYVGAYRLDQLHGMNKQVFLVERAKLPADGCTTVTLRTVSREEWTSPRFCVGSTWQRVGVLVGSQLRMSQLTR